MSDHDQLRIQRRELAYHHPMQPVKIPMPLKDENDIITESFEDYMARVEPVLPEMPEDVVSQWLYSHPQVIDDWEWIGLESLEFHLEEWATSEVPEVDKDKTSAVSTYRYNLDKRSPEKGKGRFGRLVEYFDANHTWPRSPIFLENTEGQFAPPGGWELSHPFHLLEGHHRLAVFSQFRDQNRLCDKHQIWVARKSIS